MGDENPIRTLGDYSRPNHEGYQNTIELFDGNNLVPLQSDTIRLVQNGCSFHRLWSVDPSQHLKDFLKLVDSLDLDVANRERMRLHVGDDVMINLDGVTSPAIVIFDKESTEVLRSFMWTILR
nr:MAK10-like protein [Tanacetum cinerariifolium]